MSVVVVFLFRVCDGALEGGLHVWISVSERLQPRVDQQVHQTS